MSTRNRITTVINGIRHWIALSEPSESDGNRKIRLTASHTEAANIQFTAITGEEATDGTDLGADGATPHYIEFPDIRDTEPGLMRPRTVPTDTLPAQLGTVPLFKPTPVTWIRMPVPETDPCYDPALYTIHLGTDTSLAITSSHTVGVNPKKEPYPLVYPIADADPITCWTEALCSVCRMCWTDNIIPGTAPVCQFCAAQAAREAYIAEHGHPPSVPCRTCGEDTAYGPYCSARCRSDFED